MESNQLLIPPYIKCPFGDEASGSRGDWHRVRRGADSRPVCASSYLCLTGERRPSKHLEFRIREGKSPVLSDVSLPKRSITEPSISSSTRNSMFSVNVLTDRERLSAWQRCQVSLLLIREFSLSLLIHSASCFDGRTTDPPSA